MDSCFWLWRTRAQTAPDLMRANAIRPLANFPQNPKKLCGKFLQKFFGGFCQLGGGFRGQFGRVEQHGCLGGSAACGAFDALLVRPEAMAAGEGDAVATATLALHDPTRGPLVGALGAGVEGVTAIDAGRGEPCGDTAQFIMAFGEGVPIVWTWAVLFAVPL